MHSSIRGKQSALMPSNGVAHRRVYFPGVGAVDRPAADAVALRPIGKLPAIILGANGRGKGVIIVLDQKQHRRLLHRGDVQRFVDLAGAGPAVADNRQPENILARARAAQVAPTTRLGILPKWLIMGKRRVAALP